MLSNELNSSSLRSSKNQNLLNNEQTNRPAKPKQNNYEQASRNSRLMARIQSTLTADSTLKNINVNSQKNKIRQNSTKIFSLGNISEALDRIKLADTDIDVSLADVSKSIKFLFRIYM